MTGGDGGGRACLLSLVGCSLQHERDFEQRVVVLELRQHLQQEDDGSVHMRSEASRTVDLIHRNSPDALRSGGGGSGGEEGEEEEESGAQRDGTTAQNTPRLLLRQQEVDQKWPGSVGGSSGNLLSTNRRPAAGLIGQVTYQGTLTLKLLSVGSLTTRPCEKVPLGL